MGLPLPRIGFLSEGHGQGALGGEDVYGKSAVPECYADFERRLAADGHEFTGQAHFQNGTDGDVGL